MASNLTEHKHISPLLQDARVIGTEGPQPIVYAEWLGAPGRPTVLVYGHYDVQASPALCTPPRTR